MSTPAAGVDCAVDFATFAIGWAVLGGVVSPVVTGIASSPQAVVALGGAHVRASPITSSTCAALVALLGGFANDEVRVLVALGSPGSFLSPLGVVEAALVERRSLPVFSTFLNVLVSPLGTWVGEYGCLADLTRSPLLAEGPSADFWRRLASSSALALLFCAIALASSEVKLFAGAGTLDAGLSAGWGCGSDMRLRWRR